MSREDLQSVLPKSKLNEFCRQNGIHSLALFGSLLHGNAGPNSDIDLLVEFEANQRIGFFDLSRIELELSDMLDHPVDLRTANDLSIYFRDKVLSEAQVLYAA